MDVYTLLEQNIDCPRVDQITVRVFKKLEDAFTELNIRVSELFPNENTYLNYPSNPTTLYQVEDTRWCIKKVVLQ